MATIDELSWFWLLLLAAAVAVLAAAEWPRFGGKLERFGPQGRRARERARRKSQLTLLDTESDEFAASVERDLAKLPTTRDRDD